MSLLRFCSWRKYTLLHLVLGSIVFFLCSGNSAVFAKDDDTPYLSVVRAIDTNDFGLLNPTGLSFSFETDLFFVLEASSTTQADVATMTPYESLADTDTIDVTLIDPINLAFDDLFKRLLLYDSGTDEIVAVGVNVDGYLDSSLITRYQTEPDILQQARGMTVNPTTGDLFILDTDAQQIIRIEPKSDGSFNGAVTVSMDLPLTDLVDPRGLTYNPDNNHLYFISANLGSDDVQLYELTEIGQLVAIFQLPSGEFVDPQGLAFAYSGDSTDDPSIINLYIADTGLSNELGPGQALGRIMELSLGIVYVPQVASTIQAGIDQADDGDLVLVAPGTYQESIQLSGKTIILSSYFHTTQDAAFIEQTVLDGGGSTIITVDSSVGPETKIIGFTIQNGQDGISAAAKLHILNNRFIGNRDAIDYEGGGGVCRANLFENNKDDAVDLDGSTAATIEDNIIRHNGDDGIEIRLHSYSGPTLNIIIRRNLITDNEEDGIQLIDYPGLSDRFFLIERNVIKNNAMVGLGLMDNGDTTEDYRAASIPEPIHLFNNTFINNNYAVTGGDNLIALNNILVGSSNMALKSVDGDSIAAYNLFWQNSVDHQDTNIDATETILADPELDENDQLLAGSPAINAGTASFIRNAETVLELQPDEYAGTAPDLGAYERIEAPRQRYLPIILR